MRRAIRISDNIVSPLGFSSAENYAAVRAGKTELKRHEGTFGVPEPFVASLVDREKLAAEAAAEGLPSDLSVFDTMVLLSAKKALAESGVDPRSERTRFVLSTIKGNVELLDGEDADESKVVLGYSADLLGRYFGNPNPVVVFSNACISGLCALVQGERMIQDGTCDHVVVVGAEVQSKFIVSGFKCLKALSDDLCKPFDAARTGLNLGEAAATMVLAASDGVPADSWEIVRGAIRNDANHISGPSRTGEGSYNCLRYVLEAAEKDEIAFINVHGTSTLYNDEMESIAIDRAGLIDTPINALKGYYGHTMGAAGVLESILSIRACEDGVVLGTRGFSQIGVSCPVNVSADVRATDKTAFIKLLSGFGGCNAAAFFRKGEGRKVEDAKANPVKVRTVRLSSKDTDLTELYKQICGDYPKFYKMDTLCKLGFLATELLVGKEEGRFELREDRAVVLFNASGPLCNDRHFEATIHEEWFPSPANFVYTLANIVTGEVAIRNKYKGESSCHVMSVRNEAEMDRIIREAFADTVTKSMVAGWVECSADDCFEAEISLYENN